jgi:hypothetical protein
MSWVHTSHTSPWITLITFAILKRTWFPWESRNQASSRAKFIAENCPDAFGYWMPEEVAGCFMNQIYLRLKLEYKEVDPLQETFEVDWIHETGCY